MTNSQNDKYEKRQMQNGKQQNDNWQIGKYYKKTNYNIQLLCVMFSRKNTYLVVFKNLMEAQTFIELKNKNSLIVEVPKTSTMSRPKDMKSHMKI